MSPTPLRLTGVTKAFGGRTVLSEVSLSIEPGQTVVLRGPNGAGKSTLLGCIAGTVIPDAGTIEIGGHSLPEQPLQARAALRYLPQEPEVPAGLSGAELLRFFAEVHDDPPGFDRAVAFLGFGGALDRFASTYSVGMRRQLMFAALLPGTAALWVLDEPFAGIDAQGRAKIRGAIERALDRGAGVVIAAHDRDLDDVQPLEPRTLDLEVADEARPEADRDAGG